MGFTEKFLYGNVKHDGTEKYELKILNVYMQVYDDRVVTTLGVTTRTIFYSQITNMELSYTKMFGGALYIFFAGETRRIESLTQFTFKGRDSEKMQEIKDYIQERVADIRKSNNNSNVSGVSVADEILKLKQLLDMGVLTQQEFEEQKRKLL